MLYLLLLASLLHVPALGVLGEPCGQTVKTHILTQTLTQANPNGNVTQTSAMHEKIQLQRHANKDNILV